MAIPVNLILRDAGIRHQVWFLRLSAGERKRVLDFLDRRLFPKLNALLRDRLLAVERLGGDTGPITTERLKQITAEVRALADGPMKTASAGVQSRLPAIAEMEAAWQVSSITRAVPFSMDLILPPPSVLKHLTSGAIVRGHHLKDWFENIPSRAALKVEREIQVGIAAGRTTPQIVRDILGPSGPSSVMRRDVTAVVRTATQEVSGLARQETWAENEDILDGWQWVSTLDHRICVVCVSLDGTVYDVGKGPVVEGRKLKGGDAHYQCRCTSVPVLKSWEDLGRPDLKELPASTRASMNGQVSEKIGAEDWLRDQPEWVQDEVLGPTRAGMFRDGQPVADFIGQGGEPLTLAEMGQLDRR